VVAEKHEVAAGPQQPVHLADPGGRFTPDRRAALADREVERTVRLGDRLRIAMHPCDVVESMPLAEAPGRGQLGVGVVDRVHGRAAPPHPCRHITGSTAEFDRPQPVHVIGEQRQLGVRDLPFPPPRLLLPRPLPAADPLIGHGVPVATVLGHVLGQVLAHEVSVDVALVSSQKRRPAGRGATLPRRLFVQIRLVPTTEAWVFDARLPQPGQPYSDDLPFAGRAAA